MGSGNVSVSVNVGADGAGAHRCWRRQKREEGRVSEPYAQRIAARRESREW